MKQIVLLLSLLMVMLIVIGFRARTGVVQQDNYLDYAQWLSTSGATPLSEADKRLMPGLVWLLVLIHPIITFMVSHPTIAWVVTGYLITLVAVLGSAYVMWRLTGRAKSWLGLIFPPVMLAAGTIVGTEMPTVLLLLLTVWFTTRKQWWLAASMIAFGIWIRLIMVIVGVVAVLWLFWQRNWTAAFTTAIMITLSVVALLIWNLFLFGDPWIQVTTYVEFGRATIGFWQLFLDIPRALDWGWWRQVVSGLVYLGLLIIMLIMALRIQTHHFELAPLMKWLIVAMVSFVFVLGPTPFLEEFPRFLVPVWPLLWLMVMPRVNGKWLFLLPLVAVLVVLV
jgi:hypothetical protein